ncbi:transposase [Streptomyces sp. NPDC015220]|uniref:transposase n=1 Tax=Streptomyces sp. NPDC015220 TaxID=3364947 RepID=UPI0036F6E045
MRTSAQWGGLPERFGPWKTVCERHRLWSVDGTWERLLQQVQAEADAAAQIDWDIAASSTIVRAHQHAAGARTEPPPAPAPKGAEEVEHQGETPWQSLVARLVEVVLEVRAWGGRSRGGFTSKLHLSADGRCRPPVVPGGHRRAAGGLHGR